MTTLNTQNKQEQEDNALKNKEAMPSKAMVMCNNLRSRNHLHHEN